MRKTMIIIISFLIKNNFYKEKGEYEVLFFVSMNKREVSLNFFSKLVLISTMIQDFGYFKSLESCLMHQTQSHSVQWNNQF